MTRNISDCDLRLARWVGADETPVMDQAMAGLMRGEGQLVLADASAHLSSDTDLGKKGLIVVPHVQIVAWSWSLSWSWPPLVLVMRDWIGGLIQLDLNTNRVWPKFTTHTIISP